MFFQPMFGPTTLTHKSKFLVGCPIIGMSLFTGLDYWIHKISFPAQLQPPKAIVSAKCPYCTGSLIITPEQFQHMQCCGGLLPPSLLI